MTMHDSPCRNASPFSLDYKSFLCHSSCNNINVSHMAIHDFESLEYGLSTSANKTIGMLYRSYSCQFTYRYKSIMKDHRKGTENCGGKISHHDNSRRASKLKKIAAKHTSSQNGKLQNVGNKDGECFPKIHNICGSLSGIILPPCKHTNVAHTNS